MNRLLIPALLLILPAIAQLKAQEKPALDLLKLEFDVKRAELRKPIGELQTKYEEQLGKLLDKVTSAGELEKAVAVKNEIESYKEGKSKPAGDAFPELKRLQGIYADAHAQRVATMNRNLGPVIEGYKAKLQELQTALTKEKRLEDALAVKAVIDGIKVEAPAELTKVKAPAEPTKTTNSSSTGQNEDLFVNSLGMKFTPVRIYGGKSSKKEVRFSIWETRVKDFRAFVQSTGRDAPKAPSFTQGADHPVVWISPLDASAFCKWLTQKERTEKVIGPEDQYRLPSDHEWSCAAGIGRQEDADENPMTKNGKIVDVYPWGDDWPPPNKVGNYLGEETLGNLVSGRSPIVGFSDGFRYTAPVGSFPANKFGLFDVGGNVREWCDDFYTPEKKERQISRDSGWRHYQSSVLISSYRWYGPPYDTIGFRCVLEGGEGE